MYKLAALLLLATATITTAGAQLRKIPAEVTDAFRQQYPQASGASWSDKLSYFQVEFKIDSGSQYVARYDSKGVWKWSEQNITADRLPAPVKDGYDKSKYTGDWQVKQYTVLYYPGNIMKFRLQVRKGGIQKKYLVFDSNGKLLDDGAAF